MPDLNFPRPLGVDGPHIGDVPSELPDLSLSSESADEHFGNVRQLVRLVEFAPVELQPFVLKAIAERTAAALKAVAERRFTARSGSHLEIAG
jgi:hypothetical protein